MKARIKWVEDVCFVGESGSGHAIVMDGSGNIYDFDYGSKPSVTGIRNYLESMFLNDNECLLPPPR